MESTENILGVLLQSLILFTKCLFQYSERTIAIRETNWGIDTPYLCIIHTYFLNSTRKETFVSHLNVATMQRVLFESRTCHEFATLTEGIYKPHYGNQNFFPLANGVQFIEIITKSPLPNRKTPITNPITKMEIAHTFGHFLFMSYIPYVTTYIVHMYCIII